MKRVDFYQLARDPAEAVLPLIARNTLAADARLLVVSGDAAQREAVSEALWTRLPESFLAHGHAGGAHDARQPILLSASLDPANGARFVALADGLWRDDLLDDSADRFDRAFLLFDERTIDAARALWRELKARDGLERHFWRQEDGRWREAG